MAETLTVNLGERSYPLFFGNDLTSAVQQDVQALLEKSRKVAVVTDSHLETNQGSALTAMFGSAPRFVADPGEGSKSLPVLGAIWDFLAANRVDRGGVLFAVGGGIIGDLAGFAAASFLRGIDFVQLPTTLLAMVDSSVGGKTGINISAGKNLVGAFHQPKRVYISTHFLRTLPAKEFAAGMAESIKDGLLGNLALFEELERTPLTVNSNRLPAVIRACCELKAKLVEADERETAKEGGRALLNLGHTFGHAIEQCAGYGHYLHGEAVAIGIVAAADLSVKLNLLPESEARRIAPVLAAHHLPTRLREPLSLNILMEAVARDKKVRSGLPRFIVLTALGRAETRDGIDRALVENAFVNVGARRD